MEKLGALWVKTGKNGKFMSGVVEIDGVKTNIIVFKNDHKENEKHPDYKIYLGEDKRGKMEDDDETSPF